MKNEEIDVDDASRRKFENMMCGYFGLKTIEDLYRLRELVDKMRDLFLSYD